MRWRTVAFFSFVAIFVAVRLSLGGIVELEMGLGTRCSRDVPMSSAGAKLSHAQAS